MTDSTAPTQPTTGAARPRRSGRRLVIAGLATALLLGVAGAAYAVYTKLDGGGPQPHDVLPASTQIYARLDVDPSAGQKIEIFKLIRQFPDLAEALGIKNNDQDLRELVFDAVVAGECRDLDFDDDVKPWLGERIGVSASIAEESFVIAVQVKGGEAALDDFRDALDECATQEVAFGYLDGYAIVSDNQEDVDAAIDEAIKDPLGERQAFIDDFEALGNQGIATAWFDATALADIPELKEALGSQLGDLEEVGSTAMAIRAVDSAFEIAVLGGETQDDATTDDSLATMPDDTVLGFSFSGGGEQVETNADAALEQFADGFAEGFAEGFAGEGFGGSEFDIPDFDEILADLERATGLRLPDDLAVLLGDTFSMQIGAANLENLPTLAGPEDVEALDVALRMVSDPAEATDLAERLASLATQAGIELSVLSTDDGAVLATNPTAAAALVEPAGDLGTTQSYQDVFPDGAEGGGLFVNLGTIIDKLLDSGPPDDIREGLESAEALSAIGFSSEQVEDGRTLTRLRVSFR